MRAVRTVASSKQFRPLHTHLNEAMIVHSRCFRAKESNRLRGSPQHENQRRYRHQLSILNQPGKRVTRLVFTSAVASKLGSFRLSFEAIGAKLLPSHALKAGRKSYPGLITYLKYGTQICSACCYIYFAAQRPKSPIRTSCEKSQFV